MHKYFIFIALSSASLLSAEQNKFSISKNPVASTQIKSQVTDSKIAALPIAQITENTPKSVIADDVLAKKINEILVSDALAKAYQSITFEVNDGIVNLDGHVDKKETKKHIEAEIQKIDGVKQVNSKIISYEGQPSEVVNRYPFDYGSNQNNKELIAKLRETLSKSWAAKGYDTFIIRSTNGVITISGTVVEFEDIQKAADEIRKINGVRAINNKLTLKK